MNHQSNKIFFYFIHLAKPGKVRFRAVVSVPSVFDIDVPVHNSQRHNALIAVRWQVKN